MTLPPPSNPYGAQPGPSWGGQGPGGPPPGFGGPPGGQPPWGPQPQWPGQSGPPPPRGGRVKWILGGLAVVLAIALAVVITVLVVRPDSGGSSTPTTGAASEFASANDVGPVNLITEDPTCAPWGKVVDRLSNEENGVNWGQRDSEAPASAWTTDQRSMYETVAKAMNEAAAQTAPLAKQTPHRVIRELYTQFSAYVRHFTASLDTFAAQDAYAPEIVDRLASVMVNICAGINFDLAAAQAPYVPDGPAPSNVGPPSDPASAPMFLEDAEAICSEWSDLFVKFDADTADWRAINSDIPAAQWTTEQKAVNTSAAQTMTQYADDLERLGGNSDNHVLRDFAELAAQYRRAYAHALTAYTPEDNYLANASTNLVRVVNSGCKATA